MEIYRISYVPVDLTKTVSFRFLINDLSVNKHGFLISWYGYELNLYNIPSKDFTVAFWSGSIWNRGR